MKNANNIILSLLSHSTFRKIKRGLGKAGELFYQKMDFFIKEVENKMLGLQV
jgi:hypothetical protein